MKDYPRWEEDEEEVKESASKAKKQIPTQESQPTRKPDVSVYEAYDEFQEKHEIPENDESFFYGAAFDDFNKEWQGLDAGAGSVSTEFGTTNNSTDVEPYNEDELDELLDNNSSTVRFKISRFHLQQNTASSLWKNVLNFFRHLLMTELKN